MNGKLKEYILRDSKYSKRWKLDIYTWSTNYQCG